MKTKRILTIIGTAAVLSLAVGLLRAGTCYDTSMTFGPTIQEASCGVWQCFTNFHFTSPNGCTEQTISPSYEDYISSTNCTGQTYVGKGTNVVTITETTRKLTCYILLNRPCYDDKGILYTYVTEYKCMVPELTNSSSTFTINTPLIFTNDCSCEP